MTLGRLASTVRLLPGDVIDMMLSQNDIAARIGRRGRCSVGA